MEKTIIITGASRGIGLFLLRKYVSSGEIVLGTYNNTKPQNALSSYLKKVDIENSSEVQNLVSSLSETAHHVVLINCAGVNYNAFAHKANVEEWAKVININLVGTFKVINAFLPLMRQNSFGRIINFSSVVAQLGIPGTSAYSASKAGLWGLTKAISAENAAKGITINNINLGYFNIGMIQEVPQEFQDAIKDKIPTKRFGNPEEIWETINYIINTSYLTGTSIDINGGLV